MNLDHLLKDIRSDEPQPEAIEQAAARVKTRLFPQQDAARLSTGTIRSCADFTSLIPAYLTGSLDSGRRLLLEVHTRECVPCRHALESAARPGVSNVVDFKARHTPKSSYSGWAIAASALFVAGAAGYWGFQQYPALAGGPRATVESVDGALYKVAGSTITPLAPGAELGEDDVLRTGKNSTALLRLNDGSKIEVNQRAQISVTRNWSGSTIHLGLGSIIVEAAKQRKGTLQVATADCKVSVKGTVFSVDAGTKGSRVAVVEGTVWVDHGQKHDVLRRGDSTSTVAGAVPVPIRQEFEWSRNSSQYMALLGEFSELKRQIAAIPSPGLRYQSNLMGYLPADIIALASIPNVGGTIAQASQIFHDRLKQSDTLAAWWNSMPAARRNQFELVIEELQTATQYLGNEIVIAMLPDGRDASPVLIAQLTRRGLDTYLKSQLPRAAFDGHMRFDNGLFMAAGRPSDLNRIGVGTSFTAAPLFSRINPAYQHGAEWLFAADVGRLPEMRTKLNARYMIAESRTVAGNTENRASVTFDKERLGVASWLTAPGPMGSLDFISPDAGFAASMLLKNPALIVDDLVGTISKTTSAEASDIDIRNDLAASFGGEITVALDGPLLPVPSWKIAAEMYYPDRFQGSIAKFVAAFNGKPDHEKTGNLRLTQSDVEGRMFYTLKFDKLPWQADWTFIDGYWLAAANRELLVRSIQNRQTGYTLVKSSTFISQLPHDGSANFSAVVFHNLGQTLAPLSGLFNIPKVDDKPGLICFWAANDRIEVATMGSIFGMNIESLLAMQSGGPLKMLTGGMKQ